MKIIWFISITLPDVTKHLGWSCTNFGGWLTGQLHGMKKHNHNIDLTVCSLCEKVNDLTTITIDNIHYILIPYYLRDIPSTLRDILKADYDIVHVFGTEYAHAKDIIDCANNFNLPVVLTIQGLISQLAPRLLDGLAEKYHKRSFFKRCLSIFLPTNIVINLQFIFAKRGENEIAILNSIKHVIGRTHWDKETVLNINPALNYYHINEILRDDFYTDIIWKYEDCVPHSIFFSQATYPIKGLHQLLKALPVVVEKFPDTVVYIAGDPIIFDKKGVALKFSNYLNEYNGYLYDLMQEHNLFPHIKFVGSLDESQMKQQYLQSNIFISASSLENSPNSVAEAMILGVPVITSDVGGVASVFEGNVDGVLYDFGDIEKLSSSICELFENPSLAQKYASNARTHAQSTHSDSTNTIALLNAYHDIYSNLPNKTIT